MLQCWILLLSVQLGAFRCLCTGCDSQKEARTVASGGWDRHMGQWALGSLLPRGPPMHVGTAGCYLRWLAGEVLRVVLEILTTVFVLGGLISAQLFLIIHNSSFLNPFCLLGPGITWGSGASSLCGKWHIVGWGSMEIIFKVSIWSVETVGLTSGACCRFVSGPLWKLGNRDDLTWCKWIPLPLHWTWLFTEHIHIKDLIAFSVTYFEAQK